MPPLGFVPPPRGGQAVRPPKLPTPKTPAATRPAVRAKPIDPNQQATQNAMSAFRTALSQLQSSTPAVDSAAIYAPYRASEAVTGQLGQGLQSALQQSGQAAQDQYAGARAQAQQQAAQFGISAGAGPNNSVLADTGSQPLAQQTAAYTAAAPQAAAAWQGALERSAAAKVSGAELQRAQGLTSAEQGLSAAIPGAIHNEKQLAFQRNVQRQNMGLAYSQLSTKDRQFAQQYGLDALKTQQAGAIAGARVNQTASAQAERARHDRATEAAASRRLAQGDQALAIKRRGPAATAKGLKGIPQAVKALSGSSSTGAKPVMGYKVTYVADGNGVNAGGPPVTLFVKNPASAAPPAGYLPNKTGQPVYGQAGKTSQGITPAQWDQQMRALLAQNPGQSGAVKAFLGPRPKK